MVNPALTSMHIPIVIPPWGLIPSRKHNPVQLGPWHRCLNPSRRVALLLKPTELEPLCKSKRHRDLASFWLLRGDYLGGWCSHSKLSNLKTDSTLGQPWYWWTQEPPNSKWYWTPHSATGLHPQTQESLLNNCHRKWDWIYWSPIVSGMMLQRMS